MLVSLHSMRLLSLCLLCAALSLPLASAHYASPTASAFTIDTVGEGTARVTIPDRRSAKGAPLAECSLAWETSAAGMAKSAATMAAEAAAAAKSSSERIDVASVAASLEGSCVSSSSDYWTYELCFGRSLRQYHGSDMYVLARTQSHTSIKGGKSLRMDNGDVCTALDPPKARSVLLNFACKRSASSPQLTSIVESNTCVYEVQVATSRVCADDTFPVVTNDVTRSSQNSGPLDTGSEDWFLELVELEAPAAAEGEAPQEPVLMCQAYSLEYRATSVTMLKFARFSLKVTMLQGVGSTRREVAQLPPPYRGYTARQPGRIDVEPAHLRVGYGALELDDESHFDGSLSFVKVYA